ncbi:MAG: hypothetical protein AAGL29_07215 [Bacteroidota bacterium]
MMEFEDKKRFLQKYKGTPKKGATGDVGEISNFRRFVEWLLPFVRRNRILGERYLLSEVEIRESLADKQRSEALKEREQARLFREQAISIKEERESKKVQEISFKEIPTDKRVQNIEESIERLEEIIKIWKIKYDGGPVDLEAFLHPVKRSFEEGDDYSEFMKLLKDLKNVDDASKDEE